MAATVTGTFRILDRASRPMEGMRHEAERLDKALLSVGDQMDDIGTSKQLRQFDDTEKKLRDLDRTSRQLGADNNSSLSKTRSNMRGLGDDSDKLSHKLGRLAAAFSGVQKILGLMKIPLMASGIVMLVQAVGALGGGLISLIPQLTDTLGLVGAMPAALTGMALAAVTAKLAFSGMGAALKGTKGAMGKLTPEAREFVRELKALKPIGQELKSSAQAGMLPGLSEALGSVTSPQAIGTAKRLLGGMGRTLGNTAAQAAKSFTQPGFLRDFESVGKQGEHLMSRLGSALINVAHALMSVAIAAQPFTHWLAETIQGWSVGAREAANLGQKTGSLRDYFDRSRHSLELFGSIAHNLWDTFKGLTEASRPLGESLWQSADKATEHWAHFSNSVTGQQELRNYFDSLQEPLHSIFDFVTELGKGLGELSVGGGFTKTVDALTRSVKPLVEALGNEAIGPAFARGIEQLIQLFANLSHSVTAFAHLVDLFDTFLELINSLLENVPGLTNLITGVLGAVALSKLGSRLQVLAGEWGLVATQAGRAAVAQRAAGTVPVTGGGVVGGTRGGVVAGGRAPLFGAGGRLFNTAPRAGEPFNPRTTNIPTSLGEAAAARMPWLAGGGMGAAAFGGLKAAARFLGPASLLFGGIEGMSYLKHGGNLANVPGSMYSGATFGLVPSPATGEEVEAGMGSKAGNIANYMPKSRNAARSQLEVLRIGKKDPAELLGSYEGSWSTLGVGPQVGDKTKADAQKSFAAAYKRIEAWLGGKNKEIGVKAAMEFGQAWNIYFQHGGGQKAADELLGPISKRLRTFSHKDMPEATRAFGGSMLAMLQEAKRQNPKLSDEYSKLENRVERAFSKMGEHVEVVNGKIYTGSKSEWAGIEQAIGSRAEMARERTHTAFTAMQQEALGSLVAMGYTRSQATGILKGMEKGGTAGKIAGMDAQSGPSGNGERPSVNQHRMGAAHGFASGGRIPGVGRQDNVPLTLGMAAPGELVVNGPTERDVDRDLLSAGRPPLGQRVAGETRKHSDPLYATGGRAGIQSVGKYAQGMGLSVSGGPGYGGIPSSGHVGDSLHYSGLAYDVSGAPALMTSFRRAAEQRYLGHGLNELFYDPYPYYIDNGSKVPGSLGGHSDHVHIGFFPGGPSGASAVRGLMGGMGGFKRVRSRKSGVGGAPGGVADAAMGAMARGLNIRLSQKAGMSMRPGMPRFSGGGGALGAAQLEQLARGAHMANPHLMAAIGMAESGGNPSVTNSIGARGLWQIIPSTASAFGLNYGRLTDPAYNAFGASKVLQSQGLGAWEAYTNGAYRQYMATGGRIPEFGGWFGSGGTITAHGPTILGIGENGTETAKITRGPSDGGGGGRPISVKIGAIHNNRPGDIKKQIKEEVGQALQELTDELGVDFDADEVLV